MKTGPLEVEVVGDVSVDRAIEVVANTFGAMPERPPDPLVLGSENVVFPAPTKTPILEHHIDRADTAMLLVAWPSGVGSADSSRQAALKVTSEVLKTRLIEIPRTAQGITYSPATFVLSSDVFTGYGYLLVQIEIRPGNINVVLDDIDNIAREVCTHGITADELRRARQPMLVGLERARSTNEYWLDHLAGAQTDPRRLKRADNEVYALNAVTAKSVREACRRTLLPTKTWRFAVTPGLKGFEMVPRLNSA